MKDVKAIIPIIILVLLISVVAGTFAWFSSQTQTDINGSMEVGEYIEMFFDDSVGFPKLEEKPYEGQLGYKKDGTICTGADAPYEFDFDLKFRIKASNNINVKFGFKYIVVNVANTPYFLSYAETVKRVFGAESSNDVNSAEYQKFLGEKKEIEYSKISDDRYYALDENGKYAQLGGNDKVTVYAPKHESNRTEKGYIIVDEKTNAVQEIVLKSDYVGEFFHLQYAFYPYQYETDKSGLVYRKFDTLSDTFTYNKTKTDANPPQGTTAVSGYEVFGDATKCYPHKVNIKIGLYHDNKTKPEGLSSEFGPFVFSEGAFKGCTFRFVFRVEGRDA